MGHPDTMICMAGGHTGLMLRYAPVGNHNCVVCAQSQTEMDMGADTGDLLSAQNKESTERRRGEGASAEQQNFVIAAFGDS